METNTIIFSTSNDYKFRQIVLPENFNITDVNDAMRQKFGHPFSFIGMWNYGPYKRLLSSATTIILRKGV